MPEGAYYILADFSGLSDEDDTTFAKRLAREAGVELELEDFDRIAWQTPLLCDLKPGGRYVATDLYRAGGVPLVIRRLKELGALHEDELTVTGQTIGAVADAAEEADGQDVVRPVGEPLKPNGGFAILRGNFEDEAINPLGLLVTALPPTIVAVLAFQIL